MLDFIRDIYSSFRQASLERVKSPFLGAFVFSWLCFNWQMLAILFFSSKDIEKRLAIINGSFGIVSFLIAPICTTASIVILLPQINKLITIIQDKPNSDTIEMSLASKIKIAELQQLLAENEARKKLADKKEERFIEENIISIKKDHEKAIDNLKDKESKISNLTDTITELQSKLVKAEATLKVEQESRSQVQNELIIEKENKRKLEDNILHLNLSLKKNQSELAIAKEAYDNTLMAYNELNTTLKKAESSIINFNANFPFLTDINNSTPNTYLKINKNAWDHLVSLNLSLKEKIQK